MPFEKIKNIRIHDESTWRDNIFLTFDIDWACDEVLIKTLEIIEQYNIKAAFMVTHETALIEKMRRNPNIEPGIHPNFNFLLAGDRRYGANFKEIITYYKKMVPEAVSVRSHSITQSSNICQGFLDNGITYDCNNFIPFRSGMVLKPFEFLKNYIKISYFWEDNVRFLYQEDWDARKYLGHEGLKVFNFHPINIFLNTDSLERYEKARPYLQDFPKLKEFVNTGSYGTRDILIDLIQEVSAGNA